MITEEIDPDILERIPTLKKALNEVDELTAELQIVKKESKEKLLQKDEEIRMLKEKLNEMNG